MKKAEPKPNQLFLLDGMALVYRAHFALIRTPIFTSGRMNTSALFGFVNTLLELMEKHKPTHLAVAFDTSDPTFRHVDYPEYKANRDAMPEDLSLQLPHVKRIIEAFNIPVVECPGWEADDIIGTLAKQADEAGDFETYMVTPDKDFAQLVTDTTYMYKPGRQGSAPEILDHAAICEQWEVDSPLQTIDILGLWGDSSDNIPGVPGVGEKTAKKLIAKYGSVENLLDNTHELKGKQKEKVEANREQALLSKKLVTIFREAPVGVLFDDIKISKRDDEKLEALCREFEFNGIGKRLFGKDFEAGHSQSEALSGQEELKTIADFKKDYLYIRSDDHETRKAFLRKISKEPAFCFDLETDSLDEKKAAIIGFAFSWKADVATYIELIEGDAGKAILNEVSPVFANPEVEKIGHNLKFDIGVLSWNGITVEGPFFDTMLAHSLLEPDSRHKMDYLSETILGYTPISYDSVFGGETEEPSGQLNLFGEAEMSGGPDFEKVAEYASEDADVTWQLAENLREKIKDKGQEEVFHKIECPLVPAIVAMEKEGIRLDVEQLALCGADLESSITELRTQVFEAAGTEFNINSPKQVGEIFFDRLRLVEKPKKTKTGQYKTDEQTLSALAVEHRIARDLLDYREVAKLKSTYVDTLPTCINSRTGRVHTSFHQLLTATGRLASNNPNLQNIPIRTQQGREIRKAFVPRSGEYILMAADYSQIELRVMASLSEDPAMCSAFEENQDIHTATAAKVFEVALDEVIPEMRRTAKMVNFGIIYGISAFGLAQRLGSSISRTEAGQIIKDYLKAYPGVEAFQKEVITQAQEKGYVETITGRRRYLRDINSRNRMIRSAAERTAINTPIQGSAADMIKVAMVRVFELIDPEKYRSRMLLQVHDELVFDIHQEEREELVPQIEAAMKNAIPLRVPILVETGFGKNWLEAH